MQVVVAKGNGANVLNRGVQWCLRRHPDFTYSCQASAEHIEQSAEFALLRNRSLGPLAVTVLAIALARRDTATSYGERRPCKGRGVALTMIAWDGSTARGQATTTN